MWREKLQVIGFDLRVAPLVGGVDQIGNNLFEARKARSLARVIVIKRNNYLVGGVDVLCYLVWCQNFVDEAVQVAASHDSQEFDKNRTEFPSLSAAVFAKRAKVIFDAWIINQLLQEFEWAASIECVIWHCLLLCGHRGCGFEDMWKTI